MNIQDKQKTLQAMLSHVASEQEQSSGYLALNSTACLVERTLVQEFVDSGIDGTVSVSYPRIRELTGLSGETIRNCVIKLVATRRWDSVPGTGRTPSTYTPLFLDDIATTENGGK